LSFADSYPVRQQAALAWQQLQKAAQAEGISLQAVSGYRDQTEQALIFNTQLAQAEQSLYGRQLTEAERLGPYGEQAINQVLELVAVPGYSKHHTGWAIDLTQAGFTIFNFASSPGFAWLSADNYLNARRHGFLPSYPEDGPRQGPEPEPWEYVFVGADYLGF